jgi:hypothetical protein
MEQILRLVELNNELDNLTLSLNELFKTKKLLKFNTDYIHEEWSIDKNNIYWGDDEESSLFETYENDDYFIVRIDYQQGVEDEYLIFDKLLKIKKNRI